MSLHTLHAHVNMLIFVPWPPCICASKRHVLSYKIWHLCTKMYPRICVCVCVCVSVHVCRCLWALQCNILCFLLQFPSHTRASDSQKAVFCPASMLVRANRGCDGRLSSTASLRGAIGARSIWIQISPKDLCLCMRIACRLFVSACAHMCGCVCRMHSQAARDIMRRTAGGECVCCVLGVRGVIPKCRQTEGGKDGERVWGSFIVNDGGVFICVCGVSRFC